MALALSATADPARRDAAQGGHRRARPADRGDPAGEPARCGPRAASAARRSTCWRWRPRRPRATASRVEGASVDGARRARAAAADDPQPDRQCAPPRRRRGARGDGRRRTARHARIDGARPRARRAGGRAGADLRAVLSPCRARPRAAAAAGLGLALVRQIARHHGGDVPLRRGAGRRQRVRDRVAPGAGRPDLAYPATAANSTYPARPALPYDIRGCVIGRSSSDDVRGRGRGPPRVGRHQGAGVRVRRFWRSSARSGPSSGSSAPMWKPRASISRRRWCWPRARAGRRPRRRPAGGDPEGRTPRPPLRSMAKRRQNPRRRPPRRHRLARTRPPHRANPEPSASGAVADRWFPMNQFGVPAPLRLRRRPRRSLRPSRQRRTAAAGRRDCSRYGRHRAADRGSRRRIGAGDRRSGAAAAAASRRSRRPGGSRRRHRCRAPARTARRRRACGPACRRPTSGSTGSSGE